MKKSLIHFVLCLVLTSCGNDAAEHLAGRIVPSYADRILFRTVPSREGAVFFELQTRGGKLIIRGNNAGAMAVGLNYYLKKYCNCTVSWYDYNPVEVPETMPPVNGKVRHNALVKDRFFLNYCTFGYTFAYWDWPQWERLIDWMALNGINLPLAMTAQEAVWENVWKQFGMDDQDILDYFTGPAHLPWQMMGNIDKYDGPLSREWIDAHIALQKKIIERERELGMKPVLGAFNGHVPEQIAEGHRHYTCNWIDSGDYRTHFIYPSDPLFAEIQKKYLSFQSELFGTDHIYAADLFNEMPPPCWEPDSLASISREMFRSLEAADSKAEWIQMGWMFLNASKDWTPERIEAYLGACPRGRVKILDYRGEEDEAWLRTDAFYGTPFIWCYLGNFGGNDMLEGCPGRIEARIGKVISEAQNCSGVGCVPEGLDVNQDIYEYVYENAWSFKEPASEWAIRVADDHFGGISDSFREAWKGLLDDVLFTYSNTRGTLTNLRPFYFRPSVWTGSSDYFYPNTALYSIWGKMLEDVSVSDRYVFDLVNVTRQCVGNLFMDLKKEYVRIAGTGNRNEMNRLRTSLCGILADMDTLLSTRREFSLEEWTSPARKWGIEDGNSMRYETNSRHLLTVWYDKGIYTLDDYANRNYSGLTGTYYSARWNAFFDEVEKCAANGSVFDQEQFDRKCWEIGLEWCRSTEGDSAMPEVDAVSYCRKLYNKYGPDIVGGTVLYPVNQFAATQLYAYENSILPSRPAAVFYGDSITENWATLDGGFFTSHNFVGRGISGQTSAQMLSRFRGDVIDLKPKYVVILAGINDFAKNNGDIPPEDILSNVKSMCELARAHGIKPVLCTLTPCRRIGWLPERENIASEVIEYNKALIEYAREEGIPVADYHTALADSDGGLLPEYNYDEVHVTVPAYKTMEAIILRLLVF